MGQPRNQRCCHIERSVVPEHADPDPRAIDRIAYVVRTGGLRDGPHSHQGERRPQPAFLEVGRVDNGRQEAVEANALGPNSASGVSVRARNAAFEAAYPLWPHGSISADEEATVTTRLRPSSSMEERSADQGERREGVDLHEAALAPWAARMRRAASSAASGSARAVRAPGAAARPSLPVTSVPPREPRLPRGPRSRPPHFDAGSVPRSSSRKCTARSMRDARSFSPFSTMSRRPSGAYEAAR